VSKHQKAFLSVGLWTHSTKKLRVRRDSAQAYGVSKTAGAKASLGVYVYHRCWPLIRSFDKASHLNDRERENLD
jgi:hypothetical protein